MRSNKKNEQDVPIKLDQLDEDVLNIQRKIQLTTSLLSDYKGKAEEEAGLKSLEEAQQLSHKMQQDIGLLKTIWHKLVSSASTDTPKEIKKSSYFKTISSPVESGLRELNSALLKYNQSRSKKVLNEIIELCNLYIESIPIERRQKSYKQTWSEVLPEWAHAEQVLDIQKRAVNQLYLPDEKSDARKRIQLFREIVGVEDKSQQKGKILEGQFWGEYKFKGKKYIQAWLRDSNVESAGTLRSYNEWIKLNEAKQPRDKNEVDYFKNPKEHKVSFKKGLAYYKGELLDHSREIIFVMDSKGEVYVAPESETSYDFHHSSFLSSKKVVCAGTLLVEEGRIKLITNESGHYQPKSKHLLEALKLLQKSYKLNLNEILVKDYNRYDNDQQINALRFLQTKGFALSEEDRSKLKRK